MDESGTSPRSYVKGWRAASAATKLLVAAAVGTGVGATTTMLAANSFGPMIGWDAAAAAYLLGCWLSIWPLDATATAELATKEDPSHPAADVVLIGAAVASLASVGLVLFGAGQASGTAQIVRVTLGVVSVGLSWAVVHTVFCLKYARLYFSDSPGGIDFNQSEPPDYTDFAYMAFTLGTTYQVSDTVIRSTVIRRTALKHSLVSFLFGTVILASTINLIAGLSR
jgi:uncharacterized membrane protein